MDSLQNKLPSERNPALFIGLEVGLVGVVLILIEQLLQNFIQSTFFGTLLGLFRVCIWIGVGVLAVYWLKRKGSIEHAHQSKAGLIAGVITASASAILLIIFRFINIEALVEISIPDVFSVDMLPGVLMLCWIGIQEFIGATMFSYVSTILTSMALANTQRPSLKQRIPFKEYFRKPASQKTLPQQELPPQRLQDFLSVEGLPLELHTSVAAYKRGELVNARPAFVRFLRLNPKHVYAWLWLSVMIDEPERKLECIRRALALDPGNETAQKMLAFLEKSSPYG